jgi:hypothetical protein
MDGVGGSVAVGGVVGVDVETGSVTGTAIGLDVRHANKNSKVSMTKVG